MRFDLKDFYNSVSEFKFEESIKKYKWKVYINFDMHSKNYYFDDKFAIIGSHNLTKSGIGLVKVGESNIKESGIVCNLTSSMLQYIEEVIKSSIEVDETLATILDNFINQSKEKQTLSEVEELDSELKKSLLLKKINKTAVTINKEESQDIEKVLLQIIKKSPHNFLEEIPLEERALYKFIQYNEWFRNYIIDLDRNEFSLHRPFENLVKLYKLKNKIYREKVDLENPKIPQESIEELAIKIKEKFNITVIKDRVSLLGDKILFKVFHPNH